MTPQPVAQLPETRHVEDDVLVADEVGRPAVAADERRDEEQRVGEVEDVVADEDDAAAGAEHVIEPLEVENAVPVVAGEEAGVAEEEARDEGAGVDGDPGRKGGGA